MVTTADREDTVLELNRLFPAPCDLVYKAWTDVEMIKRWHAPGDHTVASAEADVRVGGRYRFVMKAPDKDITHTATGEYQEVVPNSKLVYTWSWEDAPEEMEGETLVTVTFADREGSTEVTITHERFRDSEIRDKHSEGWCGCLENLDKFCHSCCSASNNECCEGEVCGIPEVELYIQQTGLGSDVRDNMMLGEISDEESLWQPYDGGPPIAWHVAHLRASEAIIFLGMGNGDWDAIDPEWMENYKMGSSIPADVNELPPLGAIKGTCARLREQTVAFLCTLAQEDLDKELPHRRDEHIPAFIRTYRDCLRVFPLHEGHHNGEISLIRRMLGKAKLF